MRKKTKYYLVGNAHLDPVWQWRWQEGSAEAKATIRSALDRMKEFPEFRFVCSSASVYKWVEEFAPDMFEEIKQRVSERRFIIVGGWYVQPDCNLPSGEGFARQSLYSQRYFKENFGITAKVGYNVDSFGHNLMLPQILRKSGMDSYIFMRPGHHEKDIESDIFNWISPDGSSVTAYHIQDPYCFNFNSEADVDSRRAFLDENSRTELVSETELASEAGLVSELFFYGVGNHGGGPTIRNLEVLRDYKAAHPETEFIYSDIHDFFESVRDSGVVIPEYHDDLQHHASGCYSAVNLIKSGVRRAENSLIAAESYMTLAGVLCGKKSANRVFENAWQNVCFCHFHDSMGGCSIKEVYDDAADMLGMAKDTAAVQENNALQTISWVINTSDRSKGIPVVVFNPHGFEVNTLVQVNKQCSRVLDCDGNEIVSQLVHSTTYECYWRKDTLFYAKVPPLGYTVYYLSDGESQCAVETSAKAESTVRAEGWSGNRTANEHGGTVLENGIYRIQFEEYSGYITSFVDKRTGKEIITGRSAVPVVIDEYYHDTWSHGKNYFTDEMARFSDAKVSVVESGPVRATVKVVSRYNDSTLTQYFSLGDGEKLDVRAYADWHEKHKMLKLKWQMAVENPEAYYEIPFGVIKRPADGEEEPGLNWTAVKGTNGGYAVINSNTYSSSVCGNVIYHTILRSPVFGDHGGPRTGESEYTEQGRVDFSYTLMPVKEDGWSDIVKEAKLLNKPVTNIIETWHDGKLSDKPYSGLRVECDGNDGGNGGNVVLSACKRSEDGCGTVLRLYETDGRATKFTVRGDVCPVELSAEITPWSVNTYYCPDVKPADGERAWKEVLLTEYDI